MYAEHRSTSQKIWKAEKQINEIWRLTGCQVVQTMFPVSGQFEISELRTELPSSDQAALGSRILIGISN
jgi:hypothetical protein